MAKQIASAHDALRRRRARCVPDRRFLDRPNSSAACLLSASAMACCRSSLPCRSRRRRHAAPLARRQRRCSASGGPRGARRAATARPARSVRPVRHTDHKQAPGSLSPIGRRCTRGFAPHPIAGCCPPLAPAGGAGLNVPQTGVPVFLRGNAAGEHAPAPGTGPGFTDDHHQPDAPGVGHN